MGVFDPEEIIIGGVKVMAILDETRSDNQLGTAAMNNRRTLVVQFQTADYSAKIKSGAVVTARAQKWQVSSDPDSIKKGQVATTLTLIEPERRDE